MYLVLLAVAVSSVSLLRLECMWFFCLLVLVVSTSAIDCLERVISEMTCVERDVKPYTLTHSPAI